MIEVVAGAGFEVVRVENPAAVGNGDAKLVLFVALSEQRKEGAVVVATEALQRAANGEQRRGLKVVPIESAEGPIEARNVQGSTEAGTDGIFGNPAAEVRGPHSGCQCQPGKRLEFIVEKERSQAAGDRVAFREGWRSGQIVVDEPKELAVVLPEAVKANLEIVLGDVRAEAYLAARIV